MTQPVSTKHPFWKHTYPLADGWLRCYETWFDVDEVKLAFRRNGSCHAVLQCINETHVSKLDLQRAAKLRDLFQQKLPFADVQIIVGYGRLLMPPDNLPKNVTVVSIMVENANMKSRALSKMSMN